MKIRNIGIGPRAAIGFGIIAALLLFNGVFSLMQMGALHGASKDINEHWLPAILDIQTLSDSIATIRIESQRLRGTDDRASHDKSEAVIGEEEINAERVIENYKSSYMSPEQSTLVANLQASLTGYLASLSQMIKLVNVVPTNDVAADEVSKKLGTYGIELNTEIHALVEQEQQGADTATVDASNLYSKVSIIVMICIAIALTLTVLIAWQLSRSIITPLKQALTVADTIAAGDLGKPITVVGQDEPARLLGAMAKMQEMLRSTIRGISDSASQLAAATEEMNAAADESTRGLQRQRDEIEQAATAVTQMSSAVDEVANNAVSTSALSQASSKETFNGHQQVSETVALTQNLVSGLLHATRSADSLSQQTQQTQNISKVLEVIRGVADQTNLLALNAAIEAARAGDAGRGFAVVADEVRSLAQRTQSSTQEIEGMIASIYTATRETVDALGSSAQQADQTLICARAAGAALDQITQATSQINERNLMIASATEQQALVAREVDRSLVNIRDLSNQSTAGAVQASQASAELSKLAVNLNDMVLRFAL